MPQIHCGLEFLRCNHIITDFIQILHARTEMVATLRYCCWWVQHRQRCARGRVCELAHTWHAQGRCSFENNGKLGCRRRLGSCLCPLSWRQLWRRLFQTSSFSSDSAMHFVINGVIPSVIFKSRRARGLSFQGCKECLERLADELFVIVWSEMTHYCLIHYWCRICIPCTCPLWCPHWRHWSFIILVLK